MTYDFEKQRPRELFNQQRVQGVQDDSVTMEPAFEQLPIIEEDVLIDQAGHLRTLVVRDGDSTMGPSEHISYAGQSLDREHATQFQGPGMPMDAYGGNGRAPNDHSTLKCYTRVASMFGARITSTAEASYTSLASANQTTGLHGATVGDQYPNTRGPLMFWPHTSTNGAGNANLGSVAIGVVNQNIARNDLGYVWLRGHPANGAPDLNGNVLTLSFNQTNVGQNVAIPNATADVMWDEEGIALNWDWHALKMVHSTATDFFLQWRTELTSLRTFIQHFSQNESLGYYERSGRGTLWNAIDYADIPVAMWLTHLGYLQRVGVLPDNLINTPTANSFAGFYNPFYLRVRNWDGNGSTREWMPDWVARLVDNANFSYAADRPEYGISLEDLFMGYTALMKAVAYESGMVNRSWWTPHMEFFANTAEGKAHNFNTEEARTSVQMVRSLNMLGLENRNEFLNPNTVDAPLNRLSFAYFNDWFEAGQINNVAQMDHANNIADLEAIQGLTTLTEEFKAGMQALGISSGTRYVETLRDSAVVNVKTNIIPVANWRVSTSALWWSGAGDDGFIGSTGLREGFRFANTLNFGDAATLATYGTPVGLGEDQSVTMAVPTLWSNNWGRWASTHFEVPSAAAGWSQYDERAQHARTQTLTTAAQAAGLRNWLVSHIGDLGYGTICDPNGNYLSGGADVGTYSEAYWEPNRNNQFIHLFRAISDVLKYWQSSYTALPRKSNLDIPSPSALNIVREMTMMQGESLIQKNIQELLHFLHCGMNPDFFSLQDRAELNRQLDNPNIHVRPARFAQAPGADYLTFLLPEALVAEDALEVVTLGDMLLYRTGCKRHPGAIVQLADLADHGANPDLPAADVGGGTSNRIAHTLQLVSPGTRHYMLYSRASSSVSNAARGTNTAGRSAGNGGEVTLSMNATRYFTISNRFRDGEIEYISSYVNEASNEPAISRLNLVADNSVLENTPTYDYVIGDRADGYIVNFSSARYVPGYVEYYEAWPETLDSAAAGGMGNSMCGLGGVRNVPVAAGSSVVGLTGFAIQSPGLTDFLTAAGLPAQLQLAAGDALIANNLGFDPELWRRICDARGNIDDWAWNRHNWHILAIDQDILDFDRGFFRALCAGNRIVVYGPSLRMILVNKDAEIVREQGAFYTTGSLGGVAVGKGQYSGDDSEIDLDGDVRTENGYEG